MNVPWAHTDGLIKPILRFTIQCIMLLYIQWIPWTTLFWTSWVQFCVEFLIDANYRPCYSSGKESPCNGRDLGWIPGWGRSAGGGNGYPLQYSGLENFIDCIGVTKSQTQLSNFHCHFSQYCCRKGDPFQGPKLGSCLTLGNSLLTKQEILLGKGTRVESSR